MQDYKDSNGITISAGDTIIIAKDGKGTSEGEVVTNTKDLYVKIDGNPEVLSPLWLYLDRDDIRVSVSFITEVNPSTDMIRNKIFNAIEDLVSDFTYYDRKDDEELSSDKLNQAIQSEVISVDEIALHFSLNLRKQYGLLEKEEEQVERRYAALDMTTLGFIQLEVLKQTEAYSCGEVSQVYKYIAFDMDQNKYFRTSTLEDEGLKLVSFEYFCKINGLV